MSPKLDESEAVELTGKIMVVAIIFLFVVVVFVVFLHLYAKWFWYQDGAAATTTTHRRRRLDFSGGHDELSLVPALHRHGLDPSLLKSIPVVKFSPDDFKDGLECAVCLSEVSAGEKTRLLPKCNHGFHKDCIDMWFHSHSTCPICRNPISTTHPHSSSSSSSSPLEAIIETQLEDNSTESLNFPTNVLFWGNETQVSTLGLGSFLEEGNQDPTASSTSNRADRELVIDIPRQTNLEEEDLKSPIPTRMRSLKRLLSRDRRINPCSPSGSSSSVDVQ